MCLLVIVQQVSGFLQQTLQLSRDNYHTKDLVGKSILPDA